MSNFKNRPESEMPREKLLSSGVRALSDAELIAVILQTGTRGKDVIALSIELLNRCGGVGGIEKIGVDDLLKVHGLSKAKVAKLKAAIEMGRRGIYSNRLETQRITCSRDAFLLLEPLLNGLGKENFVVILLNNQNNLIVVKRIGEGTVNAASVYPRELIEIAIRSSATGIILSHNHPSGNTTPSIEDKKLTMNMLVIGDLSGIVLHDHIIIGNNGYFSFADEGILSSMRQQFLRAIQTSV
ncbi:MAG: RadC family protein [bacterium]